MDSAAGQPTRVVVVDDDPDIRLLLHVFLDGEADLSVVAEGRDGRDAVDLAAQFAPDVMVLDVMMPNVSGVEALPAIRSASPGTRVIMFSAAPEQIPVLKTRGADAWLSKGGGFDRLIATIRNGTKTLTPQ